MDKIERLWVEDLEHRIEQLEKKLSKIGVPLSGEDHNDIMDSIGDTYGSGD